MNIVDILDKSAISELLQKAGEKGRRYKSEAQLQFELAWDIKQLLEKRKCKYSPEVRLEYFSAYRKLETGKVKKFFTDIMIIDEQGNYIPIELKYKTKSIGDNVFDDFGYHGATDLGRFDYLWDLKRIQYLKHKVGPDFEFNPELKNYCRGFAIILTNDEHYWEVTKESKAKQQPLYYDFCIGKYQEIPANTELKWKNDGVGSVVDNTWRNDHNYVVPLVFDRSIICKWDTYSEDFMFLIIET
jgi:hypothetical protein